MSSRLVLVLGDLFVPDRAPVSRGSMNAFDGPLTGPNRTFRQRYSNIATEPVNGDDDNCPLHALTGAAQFKKLLTPGKIGQILCLGNLTDKDTYEFLRSIAPDVQVVKGDFDVEAPNLPLSKIVTHGKLRIGFTHGHTIVPPADSDSLLIAARQMDVDVFLWGGTHRFEAYELEGKFFVNPGSATGAMSTGWGWETEEPTPSFVLMDVQGDVLVLYVYQLRKDANGIENVGVEKVSFRKNATAAVS